MTTRKAVVVTGAAGGIGRACCEAFALKGDQILALDLEPDRLVELERSVAERVSDVELRTFTVDVTDREALEEAVEVASTEFGGIDVFVAAAADGRLGALDQLAPDVWDRVVDVTLKGSANGCRAVVPIMRAGGGGSIVLFGSVLGRNVLLGTGAYGAAKAGIEGLVKSLAVDYASDGIRVNCIVPGTIDTPMTWQGVGPGEKETLLRYAAEDIPIGRIGTPGEVAACVCFLTSSDASYVTGTSLLVDGGILARTASRI